MRRVNRTTIGLIAITAVVAVIVTAVTVPMLLRAKPALEGERTLNLGVKELENGHAVWTGAFSLRNVSGHGLHVLGLHPSCGCVQPELPRTVVPAGETLEVPFTLTLDKPGQRTVYIDVVIGDQPPLELRLDAEAR